MAEDISQYRDIDEGYATPPSQSNLFRDDTGRASLMKELSPEEHLEDIMQSLQGKIWDKKKQKYVLIEGAKPLMNDEGRDAFFHYATSILSSIVTMSNYTNDYKRIHAITRMVTKSAIFHFHIHYKDYGINHKSKVNIISSKLLVLGLSALYKALGAGDRKAATSHISETISSITRPLQDPTPQHMKRRGILSRLFGGGE